MARETRPTNERIMTLLESISKQLGDLQRAQKEMATDLKRVTRSSR